jgi:hypothetical protein
MHTAEYSLFPPYDQSGGNSNSQDNLKLIVPKNHISHEMVMDISNSSSDSDLI